MTWFIELKQQGDAAVVNVYVPNSGDGLKRLEYRVGSWDVDFANYLADLSQKKPVILTGEGHYLFKNILSAKLDVTMVIAHVSVQESACLFSGDLNCAHQEIDIHDPKRNLKSAGFTVV